MYYSAILSPSYQAAAVANELKKTKSRIKEDGTKTVEAIPTALANYNS